MEGLLSSSINIIVLVFKIICVYTCVGEIRELFVKLDGTIPAHQCSNIINNLKVNTSGPGLFNRLSTFVPFSTLFFVNILPNLSYFDSCDVIKMREIRGEVGKKTPDKNGESHIFMTLQELKVVQKWCRFGFVITSYLPQCDMDELTE